MIAALNPESRAVWQTAPGASTRDAGPASNIQVEVVADQLVLPVTYGRFALVDPEFLALWLALLIGAVVGRRPVRARVSAVGGSLWPRSLRQRLGFLPGLLQGLGLALWVFALARPVATDQVRTDISDGVDVLLLLDRSSSMSLPDLGQGQTRLSVVKQVVADFAKRRMTDSVGASDNVGLLVFAGFPELLCPFTLDVGALEGFLEGVNCAQADEDGTGIGVALAKGAKVLSKSDAKSRVLVLLTDGENTNHDIEPLDAAELARKAGVRVYTILAGRYRYLPGPFGEPIPTEDELDSSELEAIAERTGGRFYRARDRTQLEGIYAEIEQLERTPRRERRAVELTDLARPFEWVGLGVFLLGSLLAGTWLRRLLP